MLGTGISDPHGIEGAPGSSEGLSLLDVATTLEPSKTLSNVVGMLAMGNARFTGYEIHAGDTTGSALAHPAVYFEGGADGAMSADNLILGSYIHGLFESTEACTAILEWAGLSVQESPDYREIRENAIECLADAVEDHLDLKALKQVLDLPQQWVSRG